MIQNSSKRKENSGIQGITFTMTRIEPKTLLRAINLWNNDQDEDNDNNTFLSIMVHYLFLPI